MIPTLYALCRETFLAAGPEIAPYTPGIPADPGPLRPRAPAHTPGTDALMTATPAPGYEALLMAIQRAAPMLEWRQSYKPGEGMDDYIKGSGYVEFSSERGHFAPTGTAFGIGVIGPGCHYPEHRHAPAEVYLPIAGHAEWRYPPHGWERYGPGERIVTPPNAWHSIRTGGETLVMLYAWLDGDPVNVSELR